MYTYRVYNNATGEVWEHTAPARSIAFQAALKSASHMARANIREGYGSKKQPLVRLYEEIEEATCVKFVERRLPL